ncbi:hypothetical protein COR50_13665 [Chitinophaga caeni]|uniref:Macroglobulin domain-containing protein n=1 Tax=Chitinophaga caeni TaxID=2029983 RepID=A0A291QW96_9BACT|nr:MG2 domain-containing protein [Chitinophaga caeni]ATL48124.1 hypothetical protein COR50_13665 [Chitinophaga caeni]
MSKQKKRFNRKRLVIGSFVLGCIALFAFKPAIDWADEVIIAFQNYIARNPQEKVFIHFDKDYYAPGETIWFKGYLTIQDIPDIRAKVLYVELRDPDGNVTQKQKLLVNGGVAPGSMQVPLNMKAGLYQVRAYTSWMLNGDDAFNFYRNIEIVSDDTPPAKDTGNKPGSNAAASGKHTAANLQYSVQFFPEGGDMITGVKSNVAFKAVDENGYPVDVTGKVKDSNGKVVAQIITEHDGMGVFSLTPEAGITYTAEVQTASSSKQFSLPAAKDNGIAMQVFSRADRVFYLTNLSPNADLTENYMIVAKFKNTIIYRAMLNANEGRISGFIPTKELPSGILQLTIFNKLKQPLAERLVFLQKNDGMLMFLDVNEIKRGPREMNEITLQVPDSSIGSWSVSVTDADAVKMNLQGDNIISNLLLTSEIKGYVHNPYWYFKDTTAATLHALDLVMMTNGWRRYTWKDVMAYDTNSVKKYPYEQGIEVSGTATTANGRTPLANGAVNLIVSVPKDSFQTILSAPTDLNGKFLVPNLMFRDTASIYYQGQNNDKMGRTVRVKFDTHFFDVKAAFNSPKPIRALVTLNPDSLKSYLATVEQGNVINKRILDKTIQLKEFNVVEKKQQGIDEKKYVSGLFTSSNGYTFDLVTEDPIAMNVFQYLQSRVPGLQITGDINNPSLSWRGSVPTLYLNEMQSDVSMLSTIAIQDIAMIKVFRPPFMGPGGGGAGGAIAVYTRRGDEVRSNQDNFKGLDNFKQAGFTIVKEFYHPDYSLRKPEHELGDKRLTLYWEPEIEIDRYQTGKIRFYNNDFTKHFRVIVQGFDINGNVGYIEKVF